MAIERYISLSGQGREFILPGVHHCLPELSAHKDQPSVEIFESGGHSIAKVIAGDYEAEEYFLFPGVVKEPSDLGMRTIEAFWTNGPRTIDLFASMVVGMDSFIRIMYPGWGIITPVKVYEEKPHGTEQTFQYQNVSGTQYLWGIEQRASLLTSESRYTGGFSGLLYVTPEEGFVYLENLPPKSPYGEIPFATSILMADLDIEATMNSKADLANAVLALSEAGISGWIARSGDRGRGSYHLLTDFRVDHQRFPVFLGKLMQVLTPRDSDAYLFAERLIRSNNFADAQAIAHEGLKAIPSGQKTGSMIDIRWCFHRIAEEIMTLRSLTAKGYAQQPEVVVDLALTNAVT